MNLEDENKKDEIEVTEDVKEIETKEENVEPIREIAENVEELSNEKGEDEPIMQEVKQEVKSQQQPDNKYRPVKDYTAVKEKRKVKTVVAVVVIVTLFILIIFASTIFALVNMGNPNVINGVKVKGVELVGLSKEDAKKEIEEAIRNELSKDVILRHEKYETSISPEQIEAKYDIEKATDEAYNYGRSGNIIKNNFEILSALIGGKDVNIDFSYNEKSLTDMVNDIAKKIPGAVMDNNFYIEGDKLIITRGKPGITIKKEELQKQIVEQIKNPTKNLIEIGVQNGNPENINIDKIYAQVKKEPQNAYVSQDPFEIHPSENGIDFAISLDEARKIISEQKDEYEIPLKFIEPEILTSELGSEAFPDLITKFSTRYDAGLVNRSTNLRLASDKINGTVLLPGEEFSYNRVVGERTIAAGYKEAAIYQGGEVVDGLGGGICQISSTLYDLAVQANMEITDRSNHQFVTSYIDAGKDATVVYGYIDFKFVNTRKYPVRIESVVDGGIVEMKMYGVKEDPEYDIRLETEYVGTIPYSVTYEDDDSMDAGEEYTRQYGASGYKTTTYKVYRLNGEEVKREVLSNDIYDAMTKIIVRGTKNVQPVVQTSPEQTKNEITTPSTKPSTETSAKPADTKPEETKPEKETKTNTSTTVTVVTPDKEKTNSN